MAKMTLRETLERNDITNHINPKLLVEAYLEDNDMTLTTDDKKAIEEHGMNPFRFMQFSDGQLDQLDDVELAVSNLLVTLLEKPKYLKGKDIDVPDFQKERCYGLNYLEIASVIATHLADAGYTVFLPSHEEDSDGTERILDLY